MGPERMNLTHKLIENHLVRGKMEPGEEIALKIDQTLTQDATGTAAMLELEAMGVDRVKTEVSVQYVDHNLVQEDNKNPDDHLFLHSAARRYGLWYSPPGNGVSHPLHQAHFGRPGATLLGSDSHTPAAGAIGMLAIGSGGLDVAMAMAGEPFSVAMPEVWGIELVGQLPPWTSAKDVILELLRRHGVSGGRGRILEYYGPGLDELSAMDRHVIANMGTELGATSTVFPSDDVVRRFMRRWGRENRWRPLHADPGATYDHHEVVDLSEIEPLIAMPSSPGNVERVRDVAGMPIYQAYVGSSANPGFRDFAVVARMVWGRRINPRVSLDINPSTRDVLAALTRSGDLARLVDAGARIHQAGCNGCIGMGQAPATDQISLRTVPRNFPGRSGTPEDKVCLVSPETAAASALRGEITDPREMDEFMEYPRIGPPPRPTMRVDMFVAPPAPRVSRPGLRKGPNIKSLPEFDPLPDNLRIQIGLCVGDDLSTDEILPAGSRVLPYRSNIPAIAEFAFEQVDSEYVERVKELESEHAIVAGENYGQGSSREHAALAPRYLGLRLVIAKSFARIHRQNLINFGILPVVYARATDLKMGEQLVLENVRDQLQTKKELVIRNETRDEEFRVCHDLSAREIEVLLDGGVIPHLAAA